MLPKSWTRDFTVATEEKIHRFALQIGDFNPLHHNHEAAVDAGLLGPIAPGVMIGGFLSAAIAERAPGVMVCGLEIKFPQPLYAGSVVSVMCSVISQSARRAKLSFEAKVGNAVIAKGSCVLLLPRRAEALQAA